MKKICSKCKIEKDISEFSFAYMYKDKVVLRGDCKKCLTKYGKEYRKKNEEKIRVYKKDWFSRNLKRHSLWKKEWRRKNKEHYFKQRNDYRRKVRIDDPIVRMKENFSSNVYYSLRSNKRKKHWEDIVGYTTSQLMKHLEKQFDDKMNWDNYGSYWHVDHIIPQSWFIFKSYIDIGFKMCWDLENLQPLSAINNMKKGNRYV